MRLSAILFFAISLLCANCMAGEGGASGQRDQKPNVLFIAIDDLNDWTGMLKGNPQAKTPHMDELAARGMVFTNAHCAAPARGLSRAAIMSGIRPSTSGNYKNRNSIIHNPILNNAVLLPEFFQDRGYYVCGAGKLFHGAHFIKEIKGRGFDEYYPGKKRDLPQREFKFSSSLPLSGIKGFSRQADWGPFHPDVTIDNTMDGKTAKWAAEKLLGGELEETFFLGAGIFLPHLPDYAPQKYFDMFPLEDIQLPEGYKEDDLDDVSGACLEMGHPGWYGKIVNAGQWKPAIRAYLACTAMMDDVVGRILEALEKSGYADNAIIVLWSDHGWQLGEKERWTKFALWERATKVNFVWLAPGVTKPGSVCDIPVNLLDIYPTLASLAGFEAPEDQLEGNDLSVLMENPQAPWDKTTITTYGYRNYSIRSDRYRYITYSDGTEELYDHKKEEWDHLAGDPEYAHIIKEMRKGIPDHHEPTGAIQGQFK